MADRSSLGFLGIIFGGVTLAVMLLAATVVFSAVAGHWDLDAVPAITTTLR